MAKPSNRSFPIQNTQVILGNSNSNFSGVTSTMLQTFPIQLNHLNVMVMGKHHVEDESFVLGFWQAVKLCIRTLPNNKKRVFHARRNNEMIQALVLKYFFLAKIDIVFTSTAQRHHSKFTRLLMGKMDAVISTCSMAAKYLKTPPKKIIPHGIQTKRFVPIEQKSDITKRYNIKTDKCVGIFGRVRAQKGVDLFVNANIEVLQYHTDVTAVICGAILPSEQTFVDALKAKIEKAGLTDRILFLGEQPFDDIPKIMASMDLNCALSINEGFGLTVLESMASQVPVIATDAGAWRDIIIENENGFIIEVGDEDQLKEKLLWCFSNNDQLTQMGVNGKEYILHNFKVEREAQLLCEFYQSLS